MVRDQMTPGVRSFENWVPIRVDRGGVTPMVDWCYAGSTRFTHPFFTDTVHQILRRPFSLLFQRHTTLEELAALCEEIPSLEPTGFIFHMSRCGSTLVAQMLAAVEKNIVISEAPPIDAALNLDRTENGRASVLSLIVHALGQPRHADEQRYFIKFDSWNTVDLARIRKMFPEVPWAFLYRDPVEVMVSQMRQRGVQTIPGVVGEVLPDVTLTEAMSMPAEEYCARVLARICESALDHGGDHNALFLNYHELPGAVTNALLRHFNVSSSEEETLRMQEAARFHAKTPQMFFEPDSGRKQSEASEAIRRSADKWLMPIYDRLEQVRQARRKET